MVLAKKMNQKIKTSYQVEANASGVIFAGKGAVAEQAVGLFIGMKTLH
jgi:hypothetical protein